MPSNYKKTKIKFIKKLLKIIRDSKSKLTVISDFDHTITKDTSTFKNLKNRWIQKYKIIIFIINF